MMINIKKEVHPDREAELTKVYESHYGNNEVITMPDGKVLNNRLLPTKWYFCNSKNPRFPMDSATVPQMLTGETIDFTINTERRPNCKYTNHVFSVKKISQGDKQNREHVFWADGQVGMIECKVGFIHELRVLSQAQNCGLGTHLTRLCLTDQDLNGKKGNMSPEMVKQNFAVSDDNQNRIDWFKLHCTSVWYLWLKPVEAGFVYFRAAEYEDFTKMIIETGEGEIHPDEGAADTIVYHRGYDNLGNIDPGDGKRWFNLKDRWYYCKEKRPEYKMDADIKFP